MSDTFLKVIRDFLTFLRDPLWQFLLAGPFMIILTMITWKPVEKIQQGIKKVLLMGSGLFFAAVLILAILFSVISPTKQGIGHLLSRMNDFGFSVTSLRWLDNTHLSASSKDGTTKKWDALTGENEVNISHPDSQNAADPSAQGIIEQNQSGDQYKEPMPSYDGKYIASVVADSQIITPNGPLSAHIVVKDKATGRVVITISNMSRLASLHVWWSPSSSLFAFVDGVAINTWNAATGKHLTSVEYNFQENPTRSEVFDLSWSPDSKLLATVNSLGELYLWDPVTGYISFKYQTPSNGPATITWSHNGLYAFVDMMDVPVIDVFSLVLQGSIQYVLQHDAQLACQNDSTKSDADASLPQVRFDVASNNRYIAYTCKKDPSIYIWDLSQRKPVYRYDGHNHPVSSLAWSPDGHYIASAEEQEVQVWQAIN